METGDLIFYKKYNGLWLIGRLIQWWTESPYIHVGMILKDPKFLGLTGIYMWQAEPLGGVTITPFNTTRPFNIKKYIGGPMKNEKLHDIFEITNGKPYDKNPMDWIEAIIGKDFKPQRTNSFWCSALVGCILTKLNILDKKTDWSIMNPGYLAEMKSDYYNNIV